MNIYRILLKSRKDNSRFFAFHCFVTQAEAKKYMAENAVAWEHNDPIVVMFETVMFLPLTIET